MSESEPLDKTSELYIVFPFMEAFPFEDYELTLEMEGTDPADIGVAPILIQMLGTKNAVKRQEKNLFTMNALSIKLQN